MVILIFCLFTLCTTHVLCNEIDPPNIVVITADDIGWDDISLHGSDLISTPNIDIIGIQGITIPNYYTDCQGTPSMSAFFTGKYPMTMGTQGPSIGAGEDRGVPTSERLLPSYLKDLGYVTHLVGKWQLGKSREAYLPTNRGFDTFYGSTSNVDYFTYNHAENINGTEYYGLDLFHNLQPVHDQRGHLTNVLTNHAVKLIREHNTSAPLYLHVAHAAAHVGGGLVNLQATSEDIAENSHIAHTARRFYAAMITGLDKSVGQIMAALSEMNMLNNTFVIIVSHNGAASIGVPRNYGSNLPMRGSKGTPFEGAVRSIGILWHADIKPNVWSGLFHVTDWLPTLIAAVTDNEINKNLEADLDGVNQWNSLINNGKSKRQEVIIAVDDEWGAFRDGDFKIIIGNVPNTCGYYGPDLSKTVYNAYRPSYEYILMNSMTAIIFTEKLKMDLNIAYALEKRDICNLNKQKVKLSIESQDLCVPTTVRGCLFNISADPEESQDLWDEFPKIVQHLSLRFRLLWPKYVPRSPVSFDPRADPHSFNYIWWPWVENDDGLPPPPQVHPDFPLALSAEEMRYYYDLNLNVASEKLNNYMQNMASALVDSMSSMFGYSN